MSVLSPTKTIQTELRAITAVASAAQDKSSELDVSGKMSALLFIDFGLDSATTPVGTEFRIEASQKATGNDTWRNLMSLITGVIAPVGMVTDGVEAADQTVIECGAVVPALGDIVFFKNATLSLSEWGLVVARVITGGSETVTLLDGLTNQQAQGTYYNKAEQFLIPIDLIQTPATRLRVVCNNNYAASSASCVWRCAAITADSMLGV